jgi:hypothetical protein
VESTPNQKQKMAIYSATPEAFRTNLPYLPTSPRQSGPKILEAKNPRLNFIVSL